VPKGQPPPELQEFLRRPNPAVVATIRPNGELHTAATWYEWRDDGTLLLNMDASRRRLGHLRADPRVSLTVLDERSWYSHVTMSGQVRELRVDTGLADIDRLSQRYRGRDYHNREHERWTAIVDVERWHAWGDLAGP
jgi:PPOX class probable F420-dependent enzyme